MSVRLFSDSHLYRTGSLKWTGITTTSGEPTIGAWVAEMDFGTAPEVAEAMKGAIDDGLLGYQPTWLEPRIAGVTAEFQKRRFGWDVDASHVRLVASVLPALEATIQHLVRPGAPIIVPTQRPRTGSRARIRALAFGPAMATRRAAAASPASVIPAAQDSRTSAVGAPVSLLMRHTAIAGGTPRRTSSPTVRRHRGASHSFLSAAGTPSASRSAYAPSPARSSVCLHAPSGVAPERRRVAVSATSIPMSARFPLPFARLIPRSSPPDGAIPAP